MKSKQKSQRKRTGRHPLKKVSPKHTAKWSAKVGQTSNALDLKSKIFTSKSPRTVAKSLKKSAEHSKRRKGTPLQSAMSMLNFYINRAGKKLPARDKKVLQAAKEELRELYGKNPKST